MPDRVREKPVVHAVAERYDDRVALTNSDLTPVDDLGGLEMVRSWREGVWRNAERLLKARSDAERRRVALQIEVNAATWARLMSAPEEPGYRARRDAYCRAQLAD